MSEIEDTTATEVPGFFETYGPLFAFCLLLTVLVEPLVAGLPTNSGSPEFVIPAVVAGVVGMAAVLLTDGRRYRALALVGRTAWLASIAALVATFGMTLLVPISALLKVREYLQPRGAIGVAVGLAAYGLLVVAPLAVFIVQGVRDRRSGARVRLAAVVLALAVSGVIAWMAFFPEAAPATLLRRDQVMLLVGALSWYLPAYGLAGALARRIGLG